MRVQFYVSKEISQVESVGKNETKLNLFLPKYNNKFHFFLFFCHCRYKFQLSPHTNAKLDDTDDRDRGGIARARDNTVEGE